MIDITHQVTSTNEENFTHCDPDFSVQPENKEMDPNHPYFMDGLNMNNDYFDLSGSAETVAGPFGSSATPTSRPKSKNHTSEVW